MNISEQVSTRRNRLDQIRLGAAVAVVLGHSWPLTGGPQTLVPLERWTHLGFHSYAVHVFFFLSGLLITESARKYARQPIKFAWARVRRLGPALWAQAAFLPFFLIGLGLWPEATRIEAGHYAIRLVTLIYIQYDVPAAFPELPMSGAINGSVWSLRYEAILYILLMAAAALGIMVHAWRFRLFCALLLGLSFAGQLAAQGTPSGLVYWLAEGRYLAFSVLLGVLVHRMRELPGLTIRRVLWGTLFVLPPLLYAPEPIAVYGMITLLCFWVLVVGFSGAPGNGLRHDLSYGVYLWGWPVQQCVVAAWLALTHDVPGPMTLFAMTLPPLLFVAWISWVLVERPALRCTIPLRRRHQPRTDP